MSYCCEIWGSTYQCRLKKLFMLQIKLYGLFITLITMIIHLYFSIAQKLLKLHGLVTYKTMIVLYKANNHSLNGRIQTFFKPTEAIHNYGTRKSKLFYVKKTNTTLKLLSLTVKGIKTWNSLANEITQLPSLTQFKKHSS